MCVLRLQSDVMHLGDDVTKLKLFMDVLDGTKAAVSSHNATGLCESGSFSSALKLVFCLHQLTTPISAPCLRLGSVMATLLLVLLKQWRRSNRLSYINMYFFFPWCSEELYNYDVISSVDLFLSPAWSLQLLMSCPLCPSSWRVSSKLTSR